MTVIGRVRRWADTYTDEGRYTPVGVIFHWLMAGLIIFQIGLGWVMTLVIPVGGDKLRWYEVHSAVGLAVFVLASFRVAWRMTVSDPWNDADIMGWRTTLAYIVETIFYVCFFLLPLTGWAMWSAVAPPGPLSVGGIIPWPQLPLQDLPQPIRFEIMELAESAHLVLVWVLMLLIPVHILAALKHHFWDRHDVLRGMLPQVPDWEDPRVEPHRKPTGPRLPKESETG